MASGWLAYLTRELDSFEESELRVPALEIAMLWRQLALTTRPRDAFGTRRPSALTAAVVSAIVRCHNLRTGGGGVATRRRSGRRPGFGVAPAAA